MIEAPPPDLTLEAAMEWFILVLKDRGTEFLLAGRSALDLQGEFLGSVDVDLAVAAGDWKDLGYDLEEYVQRGDLSPAGAVSRSVARYLVDGFVPVDVMNLSEIHPEIFRLLQAKACVELRLGRAGPVRAVTREGYFVLAVMVGQRGFSRLKADPMAKVREAWNLVGVRTDRILVENLLRELGAREGSFARALSSTGPRPARRRLK